MSEYILEHGQSIVRQTGAHLAISLLSLCVAAMIAIPFGYRASGSPALERLGGGFFEALRVVPSLALLVLMLPVLGTGVLPATIALVVLAVPPIFLNTVAGFKDVPDFMTESGYGIGMTDREVLMKVRVPYALPMIFAGLKTALVEVVASATLAARIGAGGLGEIIFTGLGMNRADILLTGGILVAVLSLLCGAAFDLAGRHLMRHRYIKE